MVTAPMGFTRDMALESGVVLAFTYLNSGLTTNSASIGLVTYALGIIEDVTQNHVTSADTIAPIWVILISILEVGNLK
jgi:hypothetical protein